MEAGLRRSGLSGPLAACVVILAAALAGIGCVGEVSLEVGNALPALGELDDPGEPSAPEARTGVPAAPAAGELTLSGMPGVEVPAGARTVKIDRPKTTPPRSPSECPDLFQEDHLPTYEITMSPADFASMQADSKAWVERYYPATFRYGEEEVRDAMIRYRGNVSICADKVQVAIAFDQVNPKGRFHGLKKINLDHGNCEILSEPMSMAFMRDLGINAPCANYARLVINGDYYGIFVNLEAPNRDFLQRNFGENDGPMFKNAERSKVVNEKNADGPELEQLLAATTIEELERLVDLDQATLYWAAEIALPARDNFWFAGHNFWLYRHPTRGFLYLPNDLDKAFANGSKFEGLAFLGASLEHPTHLVINDPTWRSRYLENVKRAIDAYDAERLESRLDRWWSLIRDAAESDPHHPVTEVEVEVLRARIRKQAKFLRGWWKEYGQ